MTRMEGFIPFSVPFGIGRLSEIWAAWKCDPTLPPDLQAEWDRLIDQREREHADDTQPPAAA